MDQEDRDLRRAIEEPVHVAPYDPDWPAKFSRERQRLLAAFPGAFSDVQHIGSTAVPGLAAKPIIDLLAAVPSMVVADLLVPALCADGYHASAEFNATLVGRRWLMRQAAGHRTHHLHLAVPGTPEWDEPLGFRDALRADPTLRAAYVALKRSAADRHPTDREAYTRAKGDLVQRAIRGPA